MGIFSTTAYESLAAISDNMMASLQVQTSQLTQIAETALAAGIDKYQGKDYEGAATDFERYVGIMRPYAFDMEQENHLGEATEYLANAFLKLEKTDKAIAAYKTGIELSPDRVETRAKLGNLYFSLERYGDAEDAYRGAYNINTEDPNVAFSLGQALLQQERYVDASDLFSKVKKLDPESGNGQYGLGLAFRDQGDIDAASEQFKAATEINPEFYDAWAELGYLYADTGQMDLAQDVFEFLGNKDETGLADTLNRYMYKVESPKFAFIGADSTFPRTMGARTPVSAIDAYLVNANTSKQFNMVFQFTKAMDMSSVQNRTNWNIGRSDKSGVGELYNFGVRVPDTEIKLPPIPERVVYDPSMLQATVTFTVSQNSAADGTLDPSHILFRFNGVDSFGNAMGEDGDDFTGYSGID